jgi:diadenosine tetraphosphate (Ap4A) HIT family hydrolase
MCGRITAAGSRLRESSDGLAVAFPDAYPLAPGHTLVVPRRHEPDLLGLTSAESRALWALATDLCREVKAEYDADCVFRPKPITDSRPSRSRIPRQGDH